MSMPLSSACRPLALEIRSGRLPVAAGLPGEGGAGFSRERPPSPFEGVRPKILLAPARVLPAKEVRIYVVTTIPCSKPPESARAIYNRRRLELEFSSERKPVSLGAPAQCHRSIHRMHHRRAGPPRLEQIGFQREIPFRLAVRVVNQHEARVVLQTLRLLDHGFLVLAQKLLRERPEQENGQRQIPRRDEIDAAQIAPDGRHRRAA